MKKYLVTTVLCILLVTVPGYADCPVSHTDKTNKKHGGSMKSAPHAQAHLNTTPEPSVSWHDLHWFE